MHNEYEKYESNDAEYSKKKYLYWHDSEKSYDPRYNEWYTEKYCSNDDSSHVEEYHREVEFSRDTDMSECHTSRCPEWGECRVSLEYDEEFGIGKTHIHEECEYQIDAHEYANGASIINPKKTKEEYVEGNDREGFEYASNIVYLKNRKEVWEPIKEPLYGTMGFFTITLSIGIYHMDDTTICYWL